MGYTNLSFSIGMPFITDDREKELLALKKNFKNNNVLKFSVRKDIYLFAIKGCHAGQSEFSPFESYASIALLGISIELRLYSPEDD